MKRLSRTLLAAVLLFAAPAFGDCRPELTDSKGSYALCGEGKETYLEVRKPESRKIAIGVPATGIMASLKPGMLLVYRHSFVPEKIGMDVDYALYTLDAATGELRNVYRDGRIGFGRRIKPTAYRGWAGASPTETGALLVDFVVPPNVPPHIRFVMVDYFTSKTREIGRTSETGISHEATWSPDGLVASFMLDDGSGRFLSLDITSGESRLTDGMPHMGAAPGPEAVSKILELKGLLIDGLITEDDYSARRIKLLGGTVK